MRCDKPWKEAKLTALTGPWLDGRSVPPDLSKSRWVLRYQSVIGWRQALPSLPPGILVASALESSFVVAESVEMIKL